MPEKTKKKYDKEKESEDLRRAENELADKDSACEANEKKSYYYDDAHGYEIYNPDADDDGDEG